MKKLPTQSFDGYDPNRLFNALIFILGLRSDTRLARALEVPFMLVKKIRSMEIPVTPALLIRMEEISGWSARNCRDMMGDRRLKFRFDEVRKIDVDETIAEIYASAASKKLY